MLTMVKTADKGNFAKSFDNNRDINWPVLGSANPEQGAHLTKMMNLMKFLAETKKAAYLEKISNEM